MDRVSLKAAAISIMNQAEFLTGFMLRFVLWALIAFCKMTIRHIPMDRTELVTGAICSIWPTGMPASFRWGTEVNRFPIFVFGRAATNQVSNQYGIEHALSR